MTPQEFQDVTAFLEATPGKAAGLASKVAEREWARKPSDEEFSVVESFCHLRDLEREGYRVRIERLLTEPEPDLAGFDGAAVARERDYNRQDPRAALEAFAEARRENVERLRAIRPGDLDRKGTFMGGDPISLGSLLLMMREHDEGHLKELETLAARPGKAGA